MTHNLKSASKYVEMAKNMRTPLLIDGRNLFSGSQARDAGLVYEGVGRPNENVGLVRKRAEDHA